MNRGPEQVSIGEPCPPLLSCRAYSLAFEVLGNRGGSALIEEDVHLLTERGGFEAAGCEVEDGKTTDTGMRVSLKTHAPLTLPGTLSTSGQRDQSSAVIELVGLFSA